MPPPAKIVSDARREAVVALVRAHAALEDPLTGAIWLSTKRNGVWLVEVVPSMPADARADEPMEFLPSRDFRYALHLHTGREADLLSAIDRNVAFAAAIAAGTPVPDATAVTRRLQARARKALKERT